MKCRTCARTADSIGSNQSSKSWALAPPSACRTAGFVIVLSMAWSPSALPNAESFGLSNPETTPLSIPTNPATPPVTQGDPSVVIHECGNTTGNLIRGVQKNGVDQ